MHKSPVTDIEVEYVITLIPCEQWNKVKTTAVKEYAISSITVGRPDIRNAITLITRDRPASRTHFYFNHMWTREQSKDLHQSMEGKRGEMEKAKGRQRGTR